MFVLAMSLLVGGRPAEAFDPRTMPGPLPNGVLTFRIDPSIWAFGGQALVDTIRAAAQRWAVQDLGYSINLVEYGGASNVITMENGPDELGPGDYADANIFGCTSNCRMTLNSNPAACFNTTIEWRIGNGSCSSQGLG